MDTLLGELLFPVLLILLFILDIRGVKNNRRPATTVGRFLEKLWSGQLHGEIYPYTLNKKFLSPAELHFLHTLKQATENKAPILTKVNLGDLFSVKHKQWRPFRAKINRKHVDFLICDPRTYKPVLGIELDDSRHNSAKAQRTDELKNNVFEAAGLPLLRVPVQHTYNTKELQKAIVQSVKEAPISQ